MKKISIFSLFLLFGISLNISAALAADIILTSPETAGGKSVFQAINERGSAAQTSFTEREISQKDLSALIWAAAGRNRDGRGWTVPFAMGSDPYIDLYVLLKKGAYVYDPDKNMLKMLSDKNSIDRAARQNFVGTAPCIFIFATKGSGPRIERWAEVAVGAMTQNVYLAAGALGIKIRYIQSFNRESLINILNLGPLSRIIAIMPAGFQ
ncbi:MAG: nitroreductase family protein [Synergistaceae bacterium]|nr:nitroreductase family protein [Synergistaceae bacterium]